MYSVGIASLGAVNRQCGVCRLRFKYPEVLGMYHYISRVTNGLIAKVFPSTTCIHPVVAILATYCITMHPAYRFRDAHKYFESAALN